MNEPHNPPAFPCAAYSPADDAIFQQGLSLRDWFAGQALGGLLSDSDNIERHYRLIKGVAGGDLRSCAAAFAYQYADAMLAQREKSNG